MPGSQAPPPEAATAAADVRRQVLRVITPASEKGPGKSILDRLVMVAVLCLEQSTVKTIHLAVGFRPDLLQDVLDDLVATGAITDDDGSYRLAAGHLPQRNNATEAA